MSKISKGLPGFSFMFTVATDISRSSLHCVANDSHVGLTLLHAGHQGAKLQQIIKFTGYPSIETAPGHVHCSVWSCLEPGGLLWPF